MAGVHKLEGPLQIPSFAGDPPGVQNNWIWFNSSDGGAFTARIGGVSVAFAAGLTEEQVEDFVGGLIADSAELDATYDDTGNLLSLALVPGSVALSKLANIAT